MKQYHDLLENILINGVEKESGRENMPNTISISHGSMACDLSDGFPLLTTKKMFIKGIIHELLWFFRGETNIKPLVEAGVNIWNGDAYRWYLKEFRDEPNQFSMDEFIEAVKVTSVNGPERGYRYGDLGRVYGYQWRNQNGVDQVAEVLSGLQNNPFSRYHIIDAWNKADFTEMALPPCHLLYQFIARPEGTGITLDLNMYQRSCDTFLGVPFNITSQSLLLMIMAKACNMKPGVVTWLGGDTHIYVNHVEQVKEQLLRTPKQLPTMEVTKDISTINDIESLTYEDFKLTNYDPYPAIKAELSVGLKTS